ncbi:MAG TPA: hypothetical protein VNE38_15940 [Ktedonobacteraceae bacterium]|nr:hypothetical protein [Ktedonobacteraceae bacterium]
MIVFILGRTGSGKSTTARFLTGVARDLGWSVQSFNDYYYLRDMYLNDTSQRFCPTEHDGFEVLNCSVYKEAIKSLARQIQCYHPENDRTLITVEFTSDNYRDSLQLFDNSLLSNAHFLFINADLKTCLERIRRRIFHGNTQDDYYVKDTVLLCHYPSPYMPLRVGERKAKYIHNMGSLDDLRDSIVALAPLLLEQAVHKHKPACVETSTLSVVKKFATLVSNIESKCEHLMIHRGSATPLNSTRFFIQEDVASSAVEAPVDPLVSVVSNPALVNSTVS